MAEGLSRPPKEKTGNFDLRFGKAPAVVRETQGPAGEAGLVSNGTVTETGTVCSVGQGSGVEVRERVGAGDPD